MSSVYIVPVILNVYTTVITIIYIISFENIEFQKYLKTLLHVMASGNALSFQCFFCKFQLQYTLFTKCLQNMLHLIDKCLQFRNKMAAGVTPITALSIRARVNTLL